MKFQTKTVHGGKSRFVSGTGAISTPIYQSATFAHKELNHTTGYDYTRESNPTRENLEKLMADLESAEFGLAFSSGMSAIASVFELFSPGDHIVACEDLYGGTYRYFKEISEKNKLQVSFCDTRKSDSLRKSVEKNTKAIFIETPTNPMMRISDIRLCSDIAKTAQALLIVDNTFLTPSFQRPMELGADIVVESATKYLSGHNDTMGGILTLSNPKLYERLKLIQKTTGAVLSPFDSWLTLRGIKTLALRMERIEQNAVKIASFLQSRKNIQKVYYPGLQDSEGFSISQSQCHGFGGMISFAISSAEKVNDILKGLKVITFAESLGGTETLITYPILQTHSYLPPKKLTQLGITNSLLRLSVGIENVDDLIEDLDRVL